VEELKMAGSEYISWSPIRRLMKHNGAVIVARDAVDELVDWMGQSAEKLTKTALTLTKHSKRKKITRDDILLAIKYF
jgi:histone H3/H4